ncbi:MAG: proteasome-type protease [Alphaproteobacteria bacterium]
MTYCLAIKLNQHLVFASDSRTNAGVDQISTYKKMNVFPIADDRIFIILTAGNLATTQAVINLIQRDLDDSEAEPSLRTVRYLFDAAHYIGRMSLRVQAEHGEALRQSESSAEASFILGGQVGERPHNIYLIYPQGNYITASAETPFLQIGETKYGKPILDRIIKPETSLEDAARCALVSLDSTMRSNISVGPPIDLVTYRKDTFKLEHAMSFDAGSDFLRTLQESWGAGLRRAFSELPRLEWT